MKKNIPVLHVLKVKYLSATNTLGSRVKVSSKRFKQFFIFSFDHSMTNVEDMAVSALESRGFNIVGIAEGYVISDTFKALKD
jgi:hypothetical protein